MAEQRRYQATLRIDSTFGNSGAVFTDFTNSYMPRRDAASFAVARAVVVQPDGHVIVAGTLGDEQDPIGRSTVLVRFDRTGRLDHHFGMHGCSILRRHGTDFVARALALQADGKIIVAGEAGDPYRGKYAFWLERLNASGAIDTGFGKAGSVLTRMPFGQDDGAYAVAVQADAKIVAAGYRTLVVPAEARESEFGRLSDRERERFALVRYNPDGGLDKSFVQSAEDVGSRARALYVDQSQVIVAGFALLRASGGVRQVALAGYNPQGKLVGRVSLSCNGADEDAHALAVQADRKTVVIAGSTARDSASDQHFLLARFNRATGELDPTFGGSGVVVNREFVGVARGVVVLPDGRIVAAGSAAVTVMAENDERVTRERVALVCYMPDGSADETFGTGGVRLIDLGGTEDSAVGIVRVEDKILIAGTSRVGAKSEFVLIRLVQSQH